MHRLLLILAVGAGIGIALTGCTPQERSGYRSIPQNRPADWETQPYGPVRN